MTRDDRRVIFDKRDMKGDDMYHDAALAKIMAQDVGGVINDHAEKKQLFNALRAHREHGVTIGDLKGILASLKYGSGSRFTRQEVNMLAQELDLGKIEKKHLPHNVFAHPSHLDRARHAAYFTRKRYPVDFVREAGRSRAVPGDDVMNYEVKAFLRDKMRAFDRRDIVCGDMVFTKEEEESSFADHAGQKFSMHASRLKRPDMPVKSQESLRGRGVIGAAPKTL